MQGLNQELEVEDDMSVDELKNEIEAKANVPKTNQVNTIFLQFHIKIITSNELLFFFNKNQRLIYMGRVLRDNQSLKSYGNFLLYYHSS